MNNKIGMMLASTMMIAGSMERNYSRANNTVKSSLDNKSQKKRKKKNKIQKRARARNRR